MTRAAILLAATCLFVALVTLGPGEIALAFRGPLHSAGSTSGGGGGGGQACGPESPPAQAVAAGFTTCAANYDWTVSTGTSWLPPQYSFAGPVSTVSNWLDCTFNPNTITTVPLHWQPSGDAVAANALPCPGSAIITTDPVFGGNVFDLFFAGGSPHESFSGSVFVQLQGMTNLFGVGSGSVLTPAFPNGMYVEFSYRMVDQTLPAQAGGSSFSVQNIAGGGINCYQDFNFEVYSNRVQDAGRGPGGGGGCGPLGAGAYFGTNGLSGCSSGLPSYFINPCYGNLPGTTSFNNTQFHKYGGLITTDGSTHMYFCAWVDNVFQSCDEGLNNQAAQSYTSGHTMWMPYLALDDTGPWPRMDTYFQYQRIWTCPHPDGNGQCNGSTLVTGSNAAGGGSPTYYH